MNVTENIVMRLVGLFIFIAPRRGTAFLADVHLKTEQNLAARRKAQRDKARAA